MKKIFTITAILLLVLGSSVNNYSAAQYNDQYNERSEMTYQTFYDQLSPYGRWVDYPDYGYVWIPDEGPGFQPYRTNGHWVWTDQYEWMWVSDYTWGWAPFHYGRWFYDSFYGWLWVPDYQWSPAWVAWRQGPDYYGWAPLQPGITISVNFNLGRYNPPSSYWSFVPGRYITSPRIYDYCYDNRRNNVYINNTVIINNYNYKRNVFRTGPGRSDVERYTGRINPVRFREVNSPGRTYSGNNEVRIYRPAVQRENNRQYAPRRFERNEGRMNSTANNSSRNNNYDNQNDNRDRQRVFERTNPGRQQQYNNLPNRNRFDQSVPGDRTNRSYDQSNRNNDQRRQQVINNEQEIQRRQTRQFGQERQDQPRREQRNNNQQERQIRQKFNEKRQNQQPGFERNNNFSQRQQIEQKGVGRTDNSNNRNKRTRGND